MPQRRLEVVITGDVKSAKKAFADTGADAEGLGDKVKSALGGVGVAVGAAAVGALAGVGMALKGAYDAAVESAKISRETERVIKTTGGAANVTAEHVGDLAESMSDLTGVDDELIQGNENLLLTFTNVRNEVGQGNDVFDQATALSLDMATALGTDASGAAIQLGKALNDPVKGITALSKAGVSFTEQQKEQIKEMVKAGDVLGAQKIVLAELSKEFGGAAEAAATPLEKLTVKLGNFQEAVGARLIPIVDGAATWLGNNLPKAFDEATSHLDGLLALVTPVAAAGFQRMAAAVQAATGFLAEHTEIVKVLATVVLVDLGQKITSTFVAFAKLSAQNVIGAVSTQLRSLVEYLSYTKAAFLEVAAAQGTFTATGQALTYVLSSAAARVALVSAAIMAFTSHSDEGRQAADEFAASLNIGTTNVIASEAGLRTLYGRIQDLDKAYKNASFGDKLGDIADTVIPWHDVTNSMNDMGDEIERMREHLTEGMKAAAAADKAYSELAGSMNANTVAAGGMGVMTADLSRQLKELAAHEKIDIMAPGAPEQLADLYNKTQIASPAMLGLQGAFEEVADSSADAEDKVKALKSALDALIGVHVASWDAETKVADAMRNVAAAHFAAKGALDLSTKSAGANSEELLKNRSMISGTIDSAVSLAQSIYQETGSLDKATGSLSRNRDELVRTMTQTGMNKTEAERYVNQLGLTPDNIATLVQLNTQDAPQRLGVMQGQQAQLSQGVNMVVTAYTTPAEINLARLGMRITELERRTFIAMAGYDSGARPHADGGIEFQSFADGAHVAQIASAGSMRLWAEPETGGEAYIPLSPAKRGRSTSILSQVAGMFGYGLAAPGGDSGMTVNVTVNGYVGGEDELGRVIARNLEAAQRRGMRSPVLVNS